jgi:dipeptidyl aminopeptidase/acylaminoacyl peptidase
VQASDYARIKVVTDPRLCPERGTVAFVVTSYDDPSDASASAVWLVDADGVSPPRPFTTGGPAGAPRFSPDGRWLSFIRPGDGGPSLWVAPMDGGEARRIAGPYPALTHPAWAPDSSRLAFAARTDPAPGKTAPRVVTGLHNRLDGQGWWSGPSHVHVVDLDGGEPQPVTAGRADHDQPAWSPDGQRLALVADREPGFEDRMYQGDVWLADMAGWDGTSAAPLVRITGGRGVAYEPVFSPDGAEVAFLANDAGSELWWTPVDVRVARLADGVVRSLTTGWDGSAGSRGVTEGSQLAWSADGRSVFFTAPARGAMAVHRVASSGGEVERLTHGVNHVPAFVVEPSTGRLVLTQRSHEALPTLGALDPVTGHETPLADPNEELVASLDIRPMETITHLAPDGTEIESFLVRPAGDGPFPLLLDVHGGPHGWHPTSSIRMVVLFKAAVAAGYAVLLPNPRGSGGYGSKFLEAVVGDWGGDDMEDVLGAVDHCVAAGIADPDRLHLHGYSYGGYASSWLIGHTNRFRSAAIGAPVADLFSMALTTDITSFSTGEAGGDPWADFDRYRERSPIAHLHKAATPTFVYANEGDLRCPVDQALQVFTALRLAGVEATLARYPGGSHGVATPSQIVDQITRVLAHIAAHDG